MQTPDFMPVLSRGFHADPKDGACVMEYISVLAGEGFSDLPTCTNPAIAKLAQAVNDMAHPADRHLLIPLIPRLMRTGGNHPWRAERTRMAATSRHHKRWQNSFALEDFQAITVAGVQILSDMIDEYWRVLGEPEPQEDDLTTADYELMVSAVRQ